ncbi:MAG: radical SAM protein [Bacteroidales bacterium]|nr:MAG: radical SAM protein [Bacteroidales bacterium]
METIRKVAIFRIDEKNHLAFHFPTFSMLRVEDENINVFKMLIGKQNSVEEIASICSVDISYVKGLQNQIPLDFFSDELFEDKNQTEISQLTFLCSTSCNLRCKYCYAQEGSYDYPAENMSVDTANKTIDFFVEKYSNIGSILFFGGEALLNFKLIKSVVERLENFQKLGKISYLPKYSLITNGTLLNDEIMKFLSAHEFNVTVSIDGSKVINDELRVFPNGKGSFDVIIKNIKTIKDQYPKVNIGWECTYTNLHEKMGISIEDVRDNLKEITGIEDGQIIPAINSNNLIFAPNLKKVEKDFKKMLHDDWQNIYEGKRINDIDFLGTIIHFMDKSFSRYMCAMGFFAFSIAPNGDIFPCHLITSGKKTDFLIGNVNDDKEILSREISVMSDKLKIYDKAKNENCNNCFAVGFCGFCPAVHILENNFKITEQYQDTCEIVKSQVENFLVNMAAIRIDETKWKNLLQSVDISYYKEARAC